MLTVLLALSCRDPNGINHAPSLSAAWLSPPSPTVTDRIRVVTSTHDRDGDPVSVLVIWDINGQQLKGGPVLESTHFSAGDRISAVVVPVDGRDAGTAAATTAVVVANSPPSLSGVMVSPEVPVRGEDALRCSLDGEPDDADGDAVTLQWKWLVDGVKLTDVRGNDYDTPDIPGAWTAGGEVWTCLARLSDGSDAADVSASVTIGWPDDITPLSAGAVIEGAGGGDGSGSALLAVPGEDGPSLLIGASGNDQGGDPNGGAAWLLTDPADTTLGADGRILGEEAYDRLGASMSPAGEGAFALGAWASNRSDTNAGAVFVMTGAHPVEEAPLIVLGAAKNDYAASGLGWADDADGDGVGELIIGAPGEDVGGSGAGAVWLQPVDTDGVITLEDADAWTTGSAAGEGLGAVVIGIADADGDGLADVLVGAPSGDAALLLTAGEARRLSGEEGGALGSALAGVEDVDGDGLTDILLGEPEALEGAGRVRLHSGADGAWLGEWPGEPGEALGSALAAVDGGFLLGAPGLEGVGGVKRVDSATLSVVQTFVGVEAGSAAGSALAVLGDTVAVGAPDSGAGATFLLPL